MSTMSVAFGSGTLSTPAMTAAPRFRDLWHSGNGRGERPPSLFPTPLSACASAIYREIGVEVCRSVDDPESLKKPARSPEVESEVSRHPGQSG